ncbi:hypothetical protein Aperf_G00000052275 [Anoplocephala perfoliata]
MPTADESLAKRQMTIFGSSRAILPEDPNWPYTDSPWDLFRDCQSWASGAPNASSYQTACILSHILGFVSAYIFPFVGLVSIISNLFVTYVFLFVFRKPSRQMIYLACVSAADVLTIIIFGWIWMFPAKGLPYATGAPHLFSFSPPLIGVFASISHSTLPAFLGDERGRRSELSLSFQPS